MKKYTVKLMTLAAFASLLGACGGSEPEQKTTSVPAIDIVAEGEQEMAELTSPPYVPKPVGTRPAKKLKVDLEIIEKEGEIMDGTKYLFWTFGGTVPGSFIRTRVGDEVEFTLKNHQDNKLPHNIDMHAVTGPGGGAEATLVAPGQQRTFSFKCLNPGLYVYHCAQAPVPLHIANGMYGLILVEPEGGLPPVDKEYYVMQGDFYTDGAYGAGGTQAFNQEKALMENPDYIVFNGKVGSLTQDGALTANPGETVRLFVGNGGPNKVSSFHVIGEIFDRVHVEGADLINENVQTTLIPAGGAAIVEFKVDVPGSYVLVDHSIFRAFNKGALGLLVAKGEENRKIYAKNEPTPYVSDLKISTTPKDDAIVNKTKEQQIADGKTIYAKTCVACHQAQGQGMEGAFPPLAKSDFLNADVDRAIDIVLHGKQGEVTVNGKKYNSVMTPQPLSVQEVADVLTYVYNTWDNSKKVVTPEMVQKIKK
ncbi:copper-containing nitrite reductase [Capnocytophaga granulosa]|uniref:copper-containing nitrite reductase n=1 Tax=Capnocytophaga granulosa TaxID=45242 RepID=UPI0023F2F2BE|nr:copper-containing nitrite reductase [Capnocytophaga granulosa]